MCLRVDDEAKLNFVDGKITCYKAISPDNYSWYQGFLFSPGINIAEGKPTFKEDGHLHGGCFHVYIDKNIALTYYQHLIEKSHAKLIEVQCNEEDLVAIGLDNDAAFTKIYIDESQLA